MKEEKATITMTIPFDDPIMKLAIIYQRGFLEHMVKIGREGAQENLDNFNIKMKSLGENNNEYETKS